METGLLRESLGRGAGVEVKPRPRSICRPWVLIVAWGGVLAAKAWGVIFANSFSPDYVIIAVIAVELMLLAVLVLPLRSRFALWASLYLASALALYTALRPISTAPCGCLGGWIDREGEVRWLVSLVLVLVSLMSLSRSFSIVSERVESCRAVQ